MTETLKRRILFFSLPLLTASALQAILTAMNVKFVAGMLAGTAAAIVAFAAAYFRLDDRDCVILSDKTFKPTMVVALGTLGIVTALAGFPVYGSLLGAVLVTFSGFAGAGSIAPYIAEEAGATVAEKRGFLMASLGQLAVLVLVVTSDNVAIPAIAAVLALAAAVHVRFWRIGSPMTEVSA